MCTKLFGLKIYKYDQVTNYLENVNVYLGDKYDQVTNHLENVIVDLSDTYISTVGGLPTALSLFITLCA